MLWLRVETLDDSHCVNAKISERILARTSWNPRIFKANTIRDVHLDYPRVFNHRHVIQVERGLQNPGVFRQGARNT